MSIFKKQTDFTVKTLKFVLTWYKSNNNKFKICSQVCQKFTRCMQQNKEHNMKSEEDGVFAKQSRISLLIKSIRQIKLISKFFN